ncbi:Rhs family protein [Buttiauxella brennerae ATCC 51605]|uniref:Rhs family protein n=1 Tax=Buttiauxella brennerae ATCC 51605 TaxID=1354251 RepID=A0A1B7IWL9_9ENTR|nr:PAAR-like domain-containing protein [Buttiauxella brennerae]OAT34370.1 Rhs family protein [Buttiauxella brennerae ATCC 51605]
MATRHIADAEDEFIVVNVTPDFCILGIIITPYDIVQKLSSEKVSYSRTVFARGKKILMIDSIIQVVEGNAGAGVMSGVSLGNGHCKVLTGANTVFTEGRPTARHLDEVLMNGKV